MTQRIITALILAAVGIALLALPGEAMAAAAVLVICFALYEEFHALAIAGHRPVSWPTWAGFLIGVPVMIFMDELLLPLALIVVMATLAGVIFRKEPKLEDCLMSLLPLLTLATPGLLAVKLALIPDKVTQVTMLLVMLAVPCVCDIFALLVGSTVKGPKLCPAVSPNKTISGAIGGLVGGLLTALLVGGLMWLFARDSGMLLPWWHYVLLGAVCSSVGQLGDLFASIIKRHSGMKDFSNLFPGHGGMLDRMDSIFFVVPVVFCYWALVIA